MGDIGVLGGWLLLIAVVVGAVLASIGSVYFAGRIIAHDTGPEHNSILSPFITVVALVYGALLSFTVVAGWQQFLSAETNAAAEASTLTTMYRQTIAMPQPEQAALRKQLRRYAEATQGPEWGKQEFHDIHNDGRASIADMYRILGADQTNGAASPINQAFLGELTTLTTARSERILDASPHIPPLLWSALYFGGAVLIVLTSFLRLASDRGHMVLVGSVTVLLGLLIYLVYALDHPFGPFGVTSHAFTQSLMEFDYVDNGN